MSDDEFEQEADGEESPLSELPPLAAAAVAADLASCRISPAGGPSSTPAPRSGSAPSGGMSDCTPSWLHFSASSSDGDSPRSSLARRKGKQVVSPDAVAPHPCGFMADARRASTGLMADARRAPGGFMADARRRPPATSADIAVPRPAPSSSVLEDGWVEVRRRWRRRVRHPRPPSRPVPVDLVGRCFNCLARDHVAAACRNPSRCLNCGSEGHQARVCKRGRALRGGAPRPLLGRVAAPLRPLRPSVAATSHGAGPSRRGRSPVSDSTQSERSQSTGRAPSLPEVCAPSPLREDGPSSPLPSSPPSPRPIGDPSRRPKSEICVIPRSLEIDAADARLSSCALVAVVGGTRPVVSSLQVGMLLEEFFSVQHGNTLFPDSSRRISWLNFHRQLLQTESYMLTTLMRLRFS